MKLKHIILSSCIAVPMLTMGQNTVQSTGPDGYLLRGQQMFQNHNYVGAIDQLTEAKRLSPDPTLREQADYLIALSRMERNEKGAMAALRKFVADYPASPLVPQVRMVIGNLHFYHADYAEALISYADVDEKLLAPHQAEDLVYRQAYSLLQLGQWNEAKAIYDRLAKSKRYADASLFYDAYIDYAHQDWDNAMRKFTNVARVGELGYQAQYYICQIHFVQKNYDRTIALGQTLLEDAQNRYFAPEINRLVGESYFLQSNPMEAKPYLESYLSTTEDPLVRSAAYALGVIYYNESKLDRAAEMMQRVAGTDDAIGQSAYLYSGLCSMTRGDLDAATLAFEKASSVEHDPKVTETALYNYGVAQAKGGRSPFGSVIPVFEQYLNRYPQSTYSTRVEEYLSDAYQTTNDYAQALTSLNRLTKPSEKMLRAKQNVLYRYGVQQVQAGNNDEGMHLLTQAVNMGKVDPTAYAESRLWLAEAQYREGQFTQAAENQQAYLNTVPSNTENYALAQYNLGYTYFQQRQYDQAKTAFANAVQHGSLDKNLLADAYNRLADTQYYTQDYAAAEQSYARAANSSDAHADYSLFQKAMMTGLSGQQQGKVNQLTDLVKRFPNSSYAPQALLEKANAQVVLNQADAAIATLQQLQTKYPKSEEVSKALLTMAIIEKNRNNSEKAIAHYKELVQTYPASEQAESAVEDMKLLYADAGRLTELEQFLGGIPNAPRLDVSEIDRLTFEAAEKQVLDEKSSTAKLQQYLKNFPNGAYVGKARYYMGRDAYIRKQYDAAAPLLTEALQGNTTASFAADATLMLADVEARQGKVESAIGRYKLLATDGPNADIRTTAQLAWLRLAEQEKRWTDVTTLAEQLLASGNLTATETTEVRTIQAGALEATGKSAQAEALYRELSRDLSTEAGQNAALQRARILLSQGNAKEAEKIANSIIDRGSANAYTIGQAFILLSDVYHSQGNTAQAVATLNSLKQNYPGKESDIFQAIDERLAKWNTKAKSVEKTTQVNSSADNRTGSKPTRRRR